MTLRVMLRHLGDRRHNYMFLLIKYKGILKTAFDSDKDSSMVRYHR